MKYFYWFLFILSCFGFGVSVIVHLSSLLGHGLDFRQALVPFGMIIVLAIVYTSTRKDLAAKVDPLRARGTGKWFGFDFFKTLPSWMKWTNYSIFGYFIAVFVLFYLKTHPNDPYANLGPSLPPAVTFFFSSGWMCFFWTFICRFWQGTYSNRS